MNLHIRSVVISGAMVGAVICATAAIARDTEPGPPQTISAQEAFADDAAIYASDLGVTPEEAQKRLGAQDRMWEIADAMVQLAPGRDGGRWLYHDDGFGLVVQFTGTSGVAEVTTSKRLQVYSDFEARNALFQPGDGLQRD